jgi:N-acetylmuramoyl-L-alanine amidase
LNTKFIKTFKPDSQLVSRVAPAMNVEARRNGARPAFLIMHYTGMSSAEKAIDWLARADSKVSCHYVIDEKGAVTQLVPEKLRAWHAGVSFWQGETDINSHSIGIEIQNPGHSDGYPDFPHSQIKAVIALARDIVRRQSMPQQNILAHSDVAIGRKIDPGEKFPWARLAREGVGHWVRPSPVRAEDEGLGSGAKGEAVGAAQRLLTQLGYNVVISGELDSETIKAIRAFQLHFRPRRTDGRLDRSTLSTLQRLVAALPQPRPA